MAAAEKAYGVGIAFVDGFIYQLVACAYLLAVEAFPNQVDGLRCFFAEHTLIVCLPGC